MKSWRSHFIALRSVSWLVVTAIVLLNLMPSHFHLHHADASDTSTSAQAHVLDLHAIANVEDESHHGKSHQLQASPDGLVKQLGDNPAPLLLCLLLLALLPIISSKGGQRPNAHLLAIYKAYPHFAPPLRAPPRS